MQLHDINEAGSNTDDALSFSSSSSQHRSVVYMLYGILAVLGTMGGPYLMIILSHCLVLYTVSLVKQKWLCFVAGLCSLASFKVEPFNSWQVCAQLTWPSQSRDFSRVLALGVCTGIP